MTWRLMALYWGLNARFAMTRMCVPEAIRRIKGTPTNQSSQVAVFALPNEEKGGYVDVVFAQTVETHRRIRNHDPLFLGIYDKDSHPEGLRKSLLCIPLV